MIQESEHENDSNKSSVELNNTLNLLSSNRLPDSLNRYHYKIQCNETISNLSVSISSNRCTTKIVKSKNLIKEDRVSEADIQCCINKAIDNSFFSDKKIIHISPIAYSIDSSEGISNPVRMYGDELEVELLVTYIGLNQFKNYIECITSCNIDVDRIVFSNYAAGIATLNENELDYTLVLTSSTCIYTFTVTSENGTQSCTHSGSWNSTDTEINLLII